MFHVRRRNAERNASVWSAPDSTIRPLNYSCNSKIPVCLYSLHSHAAPQGPRLFFFFFFPLVQLIGKDELLSSLCVAVSLFAPFRSVCQRKWSESLKTEGFLSFCICEHISSTALHLHTTSSCYRVMDASCPGVNNQI